MPLAPRSVHMNPSDAVAVTMRNTGRRDYRACVEFRESAGRSWQDGWIEEAHRMAQAASEPRLAAGMTGSAARDALEAAQRVIKTCVPERLGKRQREIKDEAALLISAALDRLRDPDAG